MLKWTGGRGLDKEEVGKGRRWICRVFALGKVGFISVVPALVQNMSGEPRNRKPVCGVMASAFCFGGEEQIPACSFFAFSSRRGTGPRVSHGPWCQRGGCPGLGGADWGVWFAFTSLAGTVQSLGSQWFFYCECCTRAVKMLVRTQLSLEGSPFSMTVLICNRVACGLDALPAD